MSYDSRPDTYEHIGKVRHNITLVVIELLGRANVHDASKLVAPEVEAFDVATPKLANLEYGSDEYKQSLKELGPALEHHLSNNRHHPEWHQEGVRGMTLPDLVEMLCDWKAASERVRRPTPSPEGQPEAPKYDSDFARSIHLNRERFGYSDDLCDILLNTARELGWA